MRSKFLSKSIGGLHKFTRGLDENERAWVCVRGWKWKVEVTLRLKPVEFGVSLLLQLTCGNLNSGSLLL